jgi:hypothetical protein
MAMRRREFVAILSGAAGPVVARAQQPATPVVGFIHILSFENGHTIRS